MSESRGAREDVSGLEKGLVSSCVIKYQSVLANANRILNSVLGST